MAISKVVSLAKNSFRPESAPLKVLVGGTSVSAIVSRKLAKHKKFKNYKYNELHCLSELSNSDIDTDVKNIFSFEKYDSFQKLIRIRHWC